MRYLPALLALLVLLSGCLSGRDSAPVAVPHVLNWGVIGISDVPTLDPALASDPTSISVASMVFGGLVRLDKNLHVQPDGATRWKISRDGLRYTFFLRPNLRFPSGRRVTASDFAAALQRALGQEGPSGTASFYLSAITQSSAIVHGGTQVRRGIRALNPTTLRITLSHPAAHFLTELAFPASFVPDATLLQRYGPTWTEHAAGFGPYFVSAWHHSRSLTLERNPYYYGGSPSLRRITLHFYAGEAGAILAYNRGDIDVISGWQAGEAPASHVRGLQRIPALALDYLAFNAARTPFRHLHTRQAFAASWNPALVKEAMGSTAFAARGFVPSAFGISVPAWRATHTPADYLTRGHYPGGKGFPNVVLVLPHDPHLIALARALRATWKRRLGIDVPLRPLNSKNYSAVLDAHAFDLALVRWGGDYPDPQDFLGTQLGSSSDNVTGWAGRLYDDDIVLADSYHPSDARRTALFRAAAATAERHLPLLPLDEPTVTAVIRASVQGVSLTPLGTICGNWTRARFRG